MIFFFTVTMVNLSDRLAVNEYIEIEGTDLAVRYSSLEPNGIYQGSKNMGTLKVEGDFGAEWGTFTAGDCLYINEYTATDLGLMLCSVVKIDLTTFDKQVILPNAILRGRCASGEPVCVTGGMLPSNFPETNSLCRLYNMTVGREDITVRYLDPGTAEVIYSVPDDTALQPDFEGRYLERTLGEVMAWNS
ncbi:MAG: hypothetical protein IJ751_10730 [Oscillospiraceae bacterium]|nr:hypothetical protein [Oscillospiraceae bacterium]